MPSNDPTVTPVDRTSRLDVLGRTEPTLDKAHAVRLSDAMQAQLRNHHGAKYPGSMPYYICLLQIGGQLHTCYVFDGVHALVDAEVAHEPITSLEVL